MFTQLQAIAAMGATLRELQHALAGEAGFHRTLDELAGALGRGAVPPAWASLHPPSQKPLGAWWAWLLHRHRQYSAWVEARRGPPQQLVRNGRGWKAFCKPSVIFNKACEYATWLKACRKLPSFMTHGITGVHAGPPSCRGHQDPEHPHLWKQLVCGAAWALTRNLPGSDACCV